MKNGNQRIQIPHTRRVAVLWWDRQGLRDQIDGHISFIDVVYFTAVSVTTVGYGDIVPVLAFLMITAIDMLRFALTGTWGGFPLG